MALFLVRHFLPASFFPRPHPLPFHPPTSPFSVACSGSKKELDEFGFPKEYDPDFGFAKEVWDEEWQARQRKKTKEFERRFRKEEEEEDKKVSMYREIGMRLKGYPDEEVKKARLLVSSFIRAEEEIEEKIEEAADQGKLNELVLMVIWNRLDLARRDDEKDAIRSLDLLYRRVETEILKKQASPAMRLLNELLNLDDGFDNEEWLKRCRKSMVETFPREDPLSILVPTGFDINTNESLGEFPSLDEYPLLRVDFVREVDELLRIIRSEDTNFTNVQRLDPESVAVRLKQEERQRTVKQVEALLDLAITLTW